MKKAKIKFSFHISWSYIRRPFIQYQRLSWKDKWGNPSVEMVPYFAIDIWPFSFMWVKGDYQYWEQHLWVNIWHNGDVVKAKKAWPWTDMETKTSTWVDAYCDNIGDTLNKL